MKRPSFNVWLAEGTLVIKVFTAVLLLLGQWSSSQEGAHTPHSPAHTLSSITDLFSLSLSLLHTVV